MASKAEAGLNESELDPDPIVQFRRWFAQAAESGTPLPEAVALATASPEGVPSARMVLCKGVDERGFTFFTNYESDKGRELAANPRAALVFYWPALNRQVRVTGRVSRVSAAESDAYFETRPLESRLSAAASPQSAVVPSRAALEAMVEGVRRRHRTDVPRPKSWGGYRLEPEAIEFWVHRDNRLHDRLRYRRRAEGGWAIERLAP
jgi:pyridoxamine 5'-phosphate oxidase